MRGLSSSAVILLIAVGLSLGGCLKDLTSQRERTATSMLWIGSGSTPLESSQVARLREVGLEEAVITVARLDARGKEPLERLDLPALPPSMPVTLAITGAFEGRPERAEELAEEVVESAQQLRFEVETRGAIPVGLHFDLREVRSFEALAIFLEAVRGSLDRTLLLSISLRREWLGEDLLAEALKPLDFVVPFLYGQRIYEAESGSAWDFVELERNLQKMEELDVPYLLGVVTLGTASHLGKGGGVKSRMTPLSLQEILWNRRLKLRPGFSLEGVNRRVYAVEAERRTQVGKWEVLPGETVRVVRAATSDIEELQRLLGSLELPNHLGEVYYRLPSAEERLTLSVENLLNALDSEPAAPELEFGVSLQRRTGRGWLLRLSITNLNGEITELSLMDSNYLQARSLNGQFGQVVPGDFYRFELYRAGRDGEIERTFRRSDLLRLHVPILEGQQKVESGDIEVHLRGEPRLELEGSFLLPDGRTLLVGPVTWPRPGEVDG